MLYWNQSLSSGTALGTFILLAIINTSHCSYLDIYISQKIRLCKDDFEGKFQFNLQAKSITFLGWKFRSIIQIQTCQLFGIAATVCKKQWIWQILQKKKEIRKMGITDLNFQPKKWWIWPVLRLNWNLPSKPDFFVKCKCPNSYSVKCLPYCIQFHENDSLFHGQSTFFFKPLCYSFQNRFGCSSTQSFLYDKSVRSHLSRNSC